MGKLLIHKKGEAWKKRERERNGRQKKKKNRSM